MDKKKITTKVIAKLARLEESRINAFLLDLAKVAENPEGVKATLRVFEENNEMDQSEKLQLLNEIKKKNLIKKEIPAMDRAWREILKEWNLSHVKIWSY